jgi:hypothetical protein
MLSFTVFSWVIRSKESVHVRVPVWGISVQNFALIFAFLSVSNVQPLRKLHRLRPKLSFWDAKHFFLLDVIFYNNNRVLCYSSLSLVPVPNLIKVLDQQEANFINPRSSLLRVSYQHLQHTGDQIALKSVCFSQSFFFPIRALHLMWR